MPSGAVVPVLRPERELPPPEKKDFHCSWGEIHCGSERFFFLFFTCFFVVSFSLSLSLSLFFFLSSPAPLFSFSFLLLVCFVFPSKQTLHSPKRECSFSGKNRLSCQENITQITAEKRFPGEKHTLLSRMGICCHFCFVFP